ncbi:MAG: SpoVG family protein [Bacteroidales bacterium]|nr:SpoVG family protein [Candidatus Latescibacterota bacterium]
MAPDFPISDIKVRVVDSGSDGLMGWVSIVVANAVRLDNVALRKGTDGSLFLTYPNKVSAGGTRHPYFHPINAQAAEAIQNAVLARLASLAKAVAAPEPKDKDAK